jgi:hypothetical protein
MIPVFNQILQRSALVAWALLLSSCIGLAVMVLDQREGDVWVTPLTTPRTS